MKSSVGLGLRHSFHDYVLQHRPAVPFFEVISENYLYFDGPPREFLRKIRDLYPLAFHGVSLSIGSLEPVRKDYLSRLKTLADEFDPLWISDHLCWTYNGPENSHDLLPLPLTRESLRRVISKTLQVQETLGRKIYLENPSAYVDFAANEYSEAEFLRELGEKSGCGLLLDLNNLVVNHHNLGHDPVPYLHTLRGCDVRQIHLAGHTVRENVRIDTHDSPVSAEVLELLPVAKRLWPEANPMIEWDDKIPPIEELLRLRAEIDGLWQRPAAPLEVPAAKSPASPPDSTPDDQSRHREFWHLLKTKDYISEERARASGLLKAGLPTPAHVGMNVYSSAYYNRLSDVLGRSFPVLKTMLNELFDGVILAYLEHCPPAHDSIDFAGARLGSFIAEHEFGYGLGADQRVISDIAAFEYTEGLASVAFRDRYPPLDTRALTENDWLSRKIKLKAEVVTGLFHSDIQPVIQSVRQGQPPEVPELKPTRYLFYRTAARMMSDREFSLLNMFADFRTFPDAIGSIPPAEVQEYAELLVRNEEFLCIRPD